MAEATKYRLVFIRPDLNCNFFEEEEEAPTTASTMKIPKSLFMGDEIAAGELIPAMLSDGWIPVRETGLGDGRALVVFQRNG